MHIDFRLEDAIGIIRISGKLVASNANELKVYFKTVLEKTAKIVIDLSELDFIDSTGLGALVSCLQHASGAKGDIYIANLSPKPRMVFEMTRAYKIFDVYDDVNTAIKAFEE